MMLLIPIAGLYGAAVASGSAQAVKNLFIWWRVRNLARWHNAVASVFVSVTLWGITTALCIAIKKFWGAPAIVQLVVGVVVCVAAVLVHVRGVAIMAADRKILATLFQGKEARLLRYAGLLHGPEAKLAAEGALTS